MFSSSVVRTRVSFAVVSTLLCSCLPSVGAFLSDDVFAQRYGDASVSVVDATTDVSHEGSLDVSLDVVSEASLDVVDVVDATEERSVTDAMRPSGTVEGLQAIAPLSGSVINVARPRFRWSVDAMQWDTVRIELSQDRTFPPGSTETQSGIGSAGVNWSGRPLGAGVWFWRLSGNAPGGRNSEPTPVWSFVVSTTVTALQRSAEVRFDANGDGLTELAIAAPDAASGVGEVYVFPSRGANVFPLMTPDAMQTLRGPGGVRFGTSMAAVGDVNGDGFGDLVVGAPAMGSAGAGRAYVYLGGSLGLRSSLTIELSAGTSSFGSAVARLGDVNGDGFGDFAVSSLQAGLAGSVHIYFGSATGPTNARTLRLPAPGGSLGFGVIAHAGDLNEDGFDDVVVGAPETAMSSGAVYGYLGRRDWPSGTGMEDWVLRPEPSTPNERFGAAIASAGNPVDATNQAFDLVVSAPGRSMGDGALYFFRGRTGVMGPLSLAMYPSPEPMAAFGASIATLGDSNGDGFIDLAVGAPSVNKIFVLGTGTMGFDATQMHALPRPSVWMNAGFGALVFAPGDVNNDGFDDVALCSSDALDTGRVQILQGAAGMISLTPQLDLRGAMNSRFGAALALHSFSRRNRCVSERSMHL